MKVRTYVIIDIVDITDEMVAESTSTSLSFRKNLAETQVILEFRTYFPACVAGYTKYTQEEMQDYLSQNSLYW